MNIYTLKKMHEAMHPNSHYFDRDTLKFFGERMSSMSVLKNVVKIKDMYGNEHETYCVSSLQRNAPGGPQRYYSYFDTSTFERIIT